jgi:hypothetical protein
MALFTAENAAEMAKRAADAKLAAKEQTKLAALSPEVEADFAEKHRKLRLLRVRKQQERVDKMLLEEMDAGKLDRLASAAIRLNEQERQLSNRSLPPTLKAGPVPRAKRNQEAPEPSPE